MYKCPAAALRAEQSPAGYGFSLLCLGVLSQEKNSSLDRHLFGARLPVVLPARRARSSHPTCRRALCGFRELFDHLRFFCHLQGSLFRSFASFYFVVMVLHQRSMP